MSTCMSESALTAKPYRPTSDSGGTDILDEVGEEGEEEIVGALKVVWGAWRLRKREVGGGAVMVFLFCSATYTDRQAAD